MKVPKEIPKERPKRMTDERLKSMPMSLKDLMGEGISMSVVIKGCGTYTFAVARVRYNGHILVGEGLARRSGPKNAFTLDKRNDEKAQNIASGRAVAALRSLLLGIKSRKLLMNSYILTPKKAKKAIPPIPPPPKPAIEPKKIAAKRKAGRPRKRK